MSSCRPLSRHDQPRDQIVRDEVAFQLLRLVARYNDREAHTMRDAIRDIARAVRRAEDESARHRAMVADLSDWSPGELAEAFGR